MRSLAALLAMLLLGACGAPALDRSTPQPVDAAAAAPLEYLLTSAAADFQAHRPPDPARFRDVRLGYLVTADGSRQYLLCGDFLPAAEAGEPDWAHFTTTRTSGYEQWLGSRETAFCEHAPVVWFAGDLSADLQRRLDALR